MRHRKGYKKLNRPTDQRMAVLRGIVTGLILHESVKTTVARAKEAARLADKLVQWAKRGDLHSRRLALRVIPNKDVIHKLFSEIGPRFEDRNGGYTRVIRAGMRRGDSAEMAILTWAE